MHKNSADFAGGVIFTLKICIKNSTEIVYGYFALEICIKTAQRSRGRSFYTNFGYCVILTHFLCFSNNWNITLLFFLRMTLECITKLNMKVLIDLCMDFPCFQKKKESSLLFLFRKKNYQEFTFLTIWNLIIVYHLFS